MKIYVKWALHILTLPLIHSIIQCVMRTMTPKIAVCALACALFTSCKTNNSEEGDYAYTWSAEIRERVRTNLETDMIRFLGQSQDRNWEYFLVKKVDGSIWHVQAPTYSTSEPMQTALLFPDTAVDREPLQNSNEPDTALALIVNKYSGVVAVERVPYFSDGTFSVMLSSGRVIICKAGFMGIKRSKDGSKESKMEYFEAIYPLMTKNPEGKGYALETVDHNTTDITPVCTDPMIEIPAEPATYTARPE